ncbi:hypothetical protein [Brevundimonas sp.]|uniref:hypothetical protein n=1 Tax=Brevundimonas sp. TaxID=1871086 RepID=UPI0025E0DBC9|nr:hypothetical protein [Brevundimonas sp.]
MTEEMKARIPAAVLVAVAIQTAGALLWAGGAAARISALEARVEGQGSVAERLARLEEQTVAVRQAVERLERRMEGR